MKKIKKIKVIALSLCVVFLSACNNNLEVTALSLDNTSLALSQGATAQLTATVLPSDIPPTSELGTVLWTSSDTTVARVVNGLVTAVSPGSAQIVAKAGSMTATCNVSVSAAITAITLNTASRMLLVDSTFALTAVLSPSTSPEVAANLTWTSTNPSVATVTDKGLVKAVSNGTTSIVASLGTVTAICNVSVLTSIAPSLMGSNYYLISVDDATVNNFIGTAKIAGDYRPNNSTNNLYLWNGFTAGTSSGNNFYGNNAAWLSLVVTGAGGWSGGGYNIAQGAELNKLKAVTDDTSGKYYLHLAIKSSTTNSYEIGLASGSIDAKIVLGTAAMDNIAPYSNFTRDGNWQEVEIPISVFKAKGLNYTTGMAATNVFEFLAGGTAGVKLEMDAIFIYKKP